MRIGQSYVSQPGLQSVQNLTGLVRFEDRRAGNAGGRAIFSSSSPNPRVAADFSGAAISCGGGCAGPHRDARPS